MTKFTEVQTRPPESKIRHDQYGRYLLPDPETGKERAWTRVTTLAGSLADRYGLERWDDHNIAFGIGQRPDLFARAAACKRDDTDTLNEVIAKAKEAAAASSGAVMGSAVHQFIERIERGEELAIPEPMASDVAAYLAEMKTAGIVVIPEWLERVVCVTDLPEPIAGRIDSLVNGLWPLPRVGDVKTGQDIERYGKAEIPLQEALYAHASHYFEWDGEAWRAHEMPTIDQDTAVVMHVPAGQGRCEIKEVDIAAGWDAVRLALDVRAWRRRKDLFTMFPAAAESAPTVAGDGEVEPEGEPAPSPSTNGEDAGRQTGVVAGKDGEARSPAEDPPAPPSSANPNRDPDRPIGPMDPRWCWLRDRRDAIKAAGVEQTRRLAGLWSLRDEIPTFPKGGPRTDAEIDAIAGMCDLVEMEFEMSLGTLDPTLPTPTKATRNKKGKSDA